MSAATEEGSSVEEGEGGPDPRERERLLLAMELSAVPEVYYIISDLLAGHDSMQVEITKERYAAWSAQAVSMSSQTNYADDDDAADFAIETPMDMRAHTGLSSQGMDEIGQDGIPKTISADVTMMGRQNMDQAKQGDGNDDNEFLVTEEGAVYDSLVNPADDEDRGGVQISNWYDPTLSRTATANSKNSRLDRYGEDSLSGSMRPESTEVSRSNAKIAVDLMGGADIEQYLMAGAQARQEQSEEASLAQEASDWMAFD